MRRNASAPPAASCRPHSSGSYAKLHTTMAVFGFKGHASATHFHRNGYITIPHHGKVFFIGGGGVLLGWLQFQHTADLTLSMRTFRTHKNKPGCSHMSLPGLTGNRELNCYLTRFGLYDCNFNSLERTADQSAYKIIENKSFLQKVLRKNLNESPSFRKCSDKKIHPLKDGFFILPVVNKFVNKHTAPTEAIVAKSFTRNGIIIFKNAAFFFITHVKNILFYCIGNLSFFLYLKTPILHKKNSNYKKGGFATLCYFVAPLRNLFWYRKILSKMWPSVTFLEEFPIT